MTEIRHFTSKLWKRRGRPDIVPPGVVPPPSAGSPIVDAGSLPVGTATYDVPAGAVFMATTGNDNTGNGTQGAPYATLTKALATVPTGGTVVARGGTYFEGTDTQGGAGTVGVGITKAVTVQNYPGEAVWFDGSQPFTGSWTQSGSAWNTPYTQLRDRSPTGVRGAADGTADGFQWIDPAYPCAPWTDQIFYDGLPLTQVDTLAKVGPGKFYVTGSNTGNGYWFQATSVTIGDNPAGHEVRYGAKTRFGYVNAAATLRGFGIRRYGPSLCDYGALYMSGANAALENLWMEDVECFGIQWADTADMSATKLTQRRIGHTGNNCNKADRLLFDRCDLQTCHYAHFMPTPGSGAIKVCKAQGFTLRNSVLSNNIAKGFWHDQTVDNARVLNCLIEGNGEDGVMLELGSNPLVANCHVRRNGKTSVFLVNTDKARFWNNTFAENSQLMNAPAFNIGQDARRTSQSSNAFNLDSRQPASYYDDPSHQWQINSFEMKNTVLAKPPAGRTLGMFYCQQPSDATKRAFTAFGPSMDGNVYHWDTQPQFPWVSPKADGTLDIRFNLAAWQAGTGLDASSKFFASNPLDASYNLTDSALHANAVALPADVAALIGQPAGTKHVGCFW